MHPATKEIFQIDKENRHKSSDMSIIIREIRIHACKKNVTFHASLNCHHYECHSSYKFKVPSLCYYSHTHYCKVERSMN
jgi:hypothetical protein